MAFALVGVIPAMLIMFVLNRFSIDATLDHAQQQQGKYQLLVFVVSILVWTEIYKLVSSLLW